MIKLSEKELELILNSCGNDFVQRYRGILKRDNDRIVKIVNTGMVSSGKSSLFNILIDSTEQEHFPTGAARTTTIADYFDYRNISFIDTPGIDVRNEDDALAFNTIMEADLIIMVHNIRTGPINRSEAEWLQQIVARMNDVQMRKERLIFVCTWKDTREKDIDYLEILKDVKEQVYEIVGAEIPFFDVSVKKYLNGVLKEKEALRKNSGIIELKQYLENYSTIYIERKREINRHEMKQLMEEIKELLLQEKENTDKEVKKIRNKVKDKYKSRREIWQQVYQYFSYKKQELARLEHEYDSI